MAVVAICIFQLLVECLIGLFSVRKFLKKVLVFLNYSVQNLAYYMQPAFSLSCASQLKPCFLCALQIRFGATEFLVNLVAKLLLRNVHIAAMNRKFDGSFNLMQDVSFDQVRNVLVVRMVKWSTTAYPFNAIFLFEMLQAVSD